ncbi:MAG: fused response regulator/phosphatase [bacterium]|nr:response regulator [Gammaproteobacteria bacterium]HIL83845.1 response regulator [Pseudomonadales bacterium]
MSDDKHQLLIISGSAEAEEMKLRLAEGGLNAVTIVDYPNALPVIRSALPDLILLTNEPGHSSLSLIDKIHRQFPLVTIVMVATNIAEEAMGEHLQAGASDYIYYVGAEKELLAHVVMHNLECRINAAAAAASEESTSMFRRLERDQRSGLRVQQAMLPDSPTSIRGITFNHQLYPSLIMSGDFIDYFELFDGRVAFYIADVSGHGASSAFITLLLKSLSRRLLDEFRRFLSTAEILSWINSELMQWKLEQHVTMFFGIIDQENSSLEYSNAAHFPGTILCFDQGANFLEIGGQPLGLYREPLYRVHHVDLPENYSIVMFSDGVFEILPQRTLEAKEEHLLSVVKCQQSGEDLSGMVDGLVDDLGVLSASAIPDDIAVFTVASSGRPG